MDQLVSLGGAPASVYKGLREGGRPARSGAPGGVLLLLGVGLPPLVRRGQGEGASPPSSSLSSFPPPRILFQLGKGGVLLPEGVGLLLARHLLAGQPPFEPLYTEARGTPRDTS